MVKPLLYSDISPNELHRGYLLDVQPGMVRFVQQTWINSLTHSEEQIPTLTKVKETTLTLASNTLSSS